MNWDNIRPCFYFSLYTLNFLMIPNLNVIVQEIIDALL